MRSSLVFESVVDLAVFVSVGLGDPQYELSEADAVAARWHPKTVASARSLPFDLWLRIKLCLERFADRYDEFPRSRSSINRRV